MRTSPVWVVETVYDCEGSDVEGVYSTRSAAQSAADSLTGGDRHRITKWDTNFGKALKTRGSTRENRKAPWVWGDWKDVD